MVRTADRRYVLLETLQAFGAEELAASGRADLVRGRHARYRVEWAEEAYRRTAQPGSQVFAEIDAAVADLRSAFGWLVNNGEIELAGRLVAALWCYGLCGCAPTCLAWSEQVLAADPDDLSPWAVARLGGRGLRDLDGRRRARSRCASTAGAANRQASGTDISGVVAMIHGSFELFEGRVREAAEWYHRSAEAADEIDIPFWLMARATEVMALGYAGDGARHGDVRRAPGRDRGRADAAGCVRVVLRRPRRILRWDESTRGPRPSRPGAGAGRANQRRDSSSVSPAPRERPSMPDQAIPRWRPPSTGG